MPVVRRKTHPEKREKTAAPFLRAMECGATARPTFFAQRFVQARPLGLSFIIPTIRS